MGLYDIKALEKEFDHLRTWYMAGLSNQDKERLAWLKGFFAGRDSVKEEEETP